MSHPIPKQVRQSDLMTAMQPLYELLGVTAMHVYSWPPMVIGADFVTFSVVATSEAEWSRDNGRPESMPPTPGWNPQGNEFGELSIGIRVAVL